DERVNVGVILVCGVKKKTAYDICQGLELSRALFRSRDRLRHRRSQRGAACVSREAAAPLDGPLGRGRDMTKRDWLERQYRKSPERPVRFSTVSDMPVEPLYTTDDEPADAAARVGLPGEYPYTRGVYPSMYRGRLWTMRQFAGFGTAADTNARFHFLLGQGNTGLSTAFDMPTLMGYDADHPRARGEVGREGVAVS